MSSLRYQPLRPAEALELPLRQLSMHLQVWGDPARAETTRPPLVLLHGWMDVGAAFQFLVDALHAGGDGPRAILAPDWRGHGRTRGPATDSYWFMDHLGDLDALLERLSPDAPVDLLGHSMGGNVAMIYAGVRPQRVRRLINLEGFGLPDSPPAQAPDRLAQWLDQLRTPVQLREHDSLASVAARLRRDSPRLTQERADWLAPHRAELRGDGRWHLRADPAHRRIHPVPYRAEEAVAAWRRIGAPLLWVEGADTTLLQLWEGRYPRAEFEARLRLVPRVQTRVLADCGHNLHLEQPEALAEALRAFLDAAEDALPGA